MNTKLQKVVHLCNQDNNLSCYHKCFINMSLDNTEIKKNKDNVRCLHISKCKIAQSLYPLCNIQIALHLYKEII